jgi:hypothetical protein
MVLLVTLIVTLTLVGCSNPSGQNGDGPRSPSDQGGDKPRGSSDQSSDGSPVTPVSCKASAPAEFASCVDQTRFLAELQAVTGVRPPGSTHWQQVQDHCASVLTAAGFSVKRQNVTGAVNVVGTRPGGSRTDEHVLVAAHYDHIPGCPGADDNASGVAAALEIARVLSTKSWGRTLDVACFDREEEGQIGSVGYVRDANNAGQKIAIVAVVDSIGYASEAPGSETVPDAFKQAFPDVAAQVAANQNKGNFIGIAGDSYAHDHVAAFKGFANAEGRLTISLELSASQKVDQQYHSLWRSDHAPFWIADYPAMSVTDTPDVRNPNYHCKGGQDTIDTLDPKFMMDTVKATVATVARALDDTAALPPRPPSTPCSTICAGAPGATAGQISCIAGLLSSVGVPIQTTPSCQSITTTAGCTTCAKDAGLQLGDCSLIAKLCLQ